MSKTNPTFADKIKQLQEIVDWFDSNEVDLDKAVEKFELGAKLAKELKTDISQLENKIKIIQAQ